MPLMTWTDKLSVGVESLDHDHQKLVSLINQLHDGMHAGHAQAVLGPLLDELIQYTHIHFQHEERLFARTGYPASAAHKREHDELTRQVLDVQTRYKAGAHGTLSLEVMSFLKRWLLHHIQESDKDYGPFLNAKGVH